MKKVCILVNAANTLLFYRTELVKKLINEGYEVVVSVPQGKRVDEIEQLGVRIIETNLSRRGKNPFKDLSLLREYKKILKKERPDVVLTYTIKPNIYGGLAAKKYKIPYIATITGLGTAFEKPLLKKLVTLMYKCAFKKVHAVFFQNEDNEQVFLKSKIIKKEKSVRVNGSGVNLEKFKLLPYGTDENINFFYISRIMKTKGIDEYLYAAKILTKKYSNVKFHIFGKTEELSYDKVLEKANKDGEIVYHGFQTDMQSFQQINYCTVHPTYYPEGMSNVLLEASASGRPIITTDICGCKEIIEDGYNGYLVKKKDKEDLVCVIEKFINLEKDKKEQMGLNARKKVEEQFDRKDVGDAYVSKITLLGE